MARRSTAQKAPVASPRAPEPVKAPAVSRLARPGLFQSDFLWGSLLFVALLIAYSPALNGRLVWDDAGHVTRPEIQSLHGLYRIWFEFGATQQYYPFLHSAFWIEHRFWGDAVLGYHLTNVVLHAISAFLIVAIMRRLSLPGGWLAAFVFALHPVSAESVAWISEQKNTLSTALYLASAFIYLDFDRSRRSGRYGLALLLYVMAMLAKSVTATLPVTLLIVLWWKRGKLSWKRDVIPLLPWLGLGISAGAVTSWVERTYIGATGAHFSLTVLDRCLLAGRVLCFYFAKLLWPSGLMFIYPHWKIDSGAAWQYLFPLAVAAAAVALWIYSKRSRAPLAAFLAFAAALVPALGFVNVYPFVYSYVADHFQYQASIALIVSLSAAVAWALERYRPGLLRLAPAGAGVLAVGLGFLTWQQSAVYRDGETLYRETIARNSQCWMCYLNLALLVGSTPGHSGEAIALTKNAIAVEPGFAQAWVNLGEFYSDSGHAAEAMPDYRKAVAIAPEMESAHVALAYGIMATAGSTGEAVTEFRTAIRMTPADPKAYLGLGDALIDQPGREQEAIRNYRKAVELNPSSAESHYELGNALKQTPDALSEEIAEYEKALSLNPNYPEAHVNLGSAFLRTPGGADKAIVQYREALRIKPDYAEAHYNLGTLLSDMPNRTQEAITEYEAALRYKPHYAQAHANLGIALMDIPGRMPEAIAHFQEAVQDDPKLAEAQYAWGMALSDMPGHAAEAIAHFRAALKAQPDFGPARDILARLHAL